jgi:hypothetical protein
MENEHGIRLCLLLHLVEVYETIHDVSMYRFVRSIQRTILDTIIGFMDKSCRCDLLVIRERCSSVGYADSVDQRTNNLLGEEDHLR